ncbi:BZ3501_MvSof-1269-A2-R1_Chr12-1g03341 [Microbotryum saponariae]|nr:BZ3501_MvSof-1269-A2-R1_Chr12-1g03341 [Microbotryum saponariae]
MHARGQSRSGIRSPKVWQWLQLRQAIPNDDSVVLALRTACRRDGQRSISILACVDQSIGGEKRVSGLESRVG